jgi:hypothetical protein
MPIDRRRFLKGAGALIALPTLPSLGWSRFASAAATPIRPKRMIFLAMGWGVTHETWYPDQKQTGTDWTITDGLKPLERHKQDITIVQNCYHQFSSDAHSASTFWLTGANKFGVPGKSFSNTISVDQVAAEEFGKETRFPSISASTLYAEGGHGAQASWNRQGKPVANIDNPVNVFHKLFSDDKTPVEVRQKDLTRQKSVLDTVLEDANDAKRGLGRDDLDKLGEYFESIRDIETRLAKEEQWLTVPKAKPTDPIAEPAKGVSGKDEIRVMYDLMVAAFQADATRVFTYRQPVDSLLRSIGVNLAGHNMSHYDMGPRKEGSQARDRAASELLAHLIDRLKAVKEADGSSLFDHTSVVFGSNVRAQHYMDNCPTVLTGGGAGIKLGHNIVMPDPKTPLCNVWLTLLQGVGVKADSFGDSTGSIEELVA